MKQQKLVIVYLSAGDYLLVVNWLIIGQVAQTKGEQGDTEVDGATPSLITINKFEYE